MTLLVWSLVEEVLVPGHLMLHYWVRLTHSGYQLVTLAPVAPVAHSLHEVKGGQYVSSICYHPEPHRRKQALSVVQCNRLPNDHPGQKSSGQRHNPLAEYGAFMRICHGHASAGPDASPHLPVYWGTAYESGFADSYLVTTLPESPL